MEGAEMEKKCVISCGRECDAPLVVINSFQDDGGRTETAIRNMTAKDFSLLTVNGLEWNSEMTPWQSPSPRHGEAPYSGNAGKYLEELTGTIIPRATAENDLKPCWIAIAGYSLAGLFALYSIYRSTLFSRFASVSGSLWYEGFTEYAESQPMAVRPQKIYLSLGTKEAHVRNIAMRSVGENTEKLLKFYSEKGIEIIFEKNPGNHFQDAEKRMAKAVAWLLEE